MLQALLSVASLLLGVACLQAGSGLYGSFAALRMSAEGFPTLAIGVIGSAYFAGFVAGTLTVNRVIARVGHIRTFTVLASGLCILTLAQALQVAPLPWALARALQGWCIAGLFVVAESWVNDRTGPETRGQVFAFYMIANYLALGLAQFLLPLAPVQADRHFLLGAILFSACLLPVALTGAMSPAPFQMRPLGLARLFRVSPLGMAGCFASGAMNGAFYALAPVFAVRVGFDADRVAGFMGAVIIAGLVLQWPVGRLSDIFDRRTILVALAAATALLTLLISALAGASFWLLLPAACLYGGVCFTIYPVAVAHANDHATQEELVPLAAGLLLSYGLGAAAGPLLGSAAMDRFGGHGLWLYVATVALLLTLYGGWRMTRRSAPPMAEQGPFVMLPRTSPVVAQLDPRAVDEAAEPAPQAEVAAGGSG